MHAPNTIVRRLSEPRPDPLDISDAELERLAATFVTPSDDVRAEIADADTRRLLRERSAVARMRDALGERTELQIVKHIGSWRRGGGAHIKRRWWAMYSPDGDQLVTTAECLSPAEAVETLLRQVRDRGLWPKGTVNVNTITGTAMEQARQEIDPAAAAQGAGDDEGDKFGTEQRPDRFETI